MADAQFTSFLAHFLGDVWEIGEETPGQDRSRLSVRCGISYKAHTNLKAQVRTKQGMDRMNTCPRVWRIVMGLNEALNERHDVAGHDIAPFSGEDE